MERRGARREECVNVIECEKKEKKATGSRTWVNSFDSCGEEWGKRMRGRECAGVACALLALC